VPLVKFFLITPTTLFRLQCAAPLYSNHQRKSVISFVIYNLNRNLRFGQFSIGLLLRSNPRVKRRYCTGRTRQWTRTHTHAHARAHSFAPVRALYTHNNNNNNNNTHSYDMHTCTCIRVHDLSSCIVKKLFFKGKKDSRVRRR
jgi:hypothetical protein